MAVAKIRTGVSIGFNCGTRTVFRKSATALCGVHRVSSAGKAGSCNLSMNFTQNVVSVTNSETCQDISRYQMISNKPSNEPFRHHDDHQIILRLSVGYTFAFTAKELHPDTQPSVRGIECQDRSRVYLESTIQNDQGQRISCSVKMCQRSKS